MEISFNIPSNEHCRFNLLYKSVSLPLFITSVSLGLGHFSSFRTPAILPWTLSNTGVCLFYLAHFSECRLLCNIILHLYCALCICNVSLLSCTCAGVIYRWCFCFTPALLKLFCDKTLERDREQQTKQLVFHLHHKATLLQKEKITSQTAEYA